MTKSGFTAAILSTASARVSWAEGCIPALNPMCESLIWPKVNWPISPARASPSARKRRGTPPANVHTMPAPPHTRCFKARRRPSSFDPTTLLMLLLSRMTQCSAADVKGDSRGASGIRHRPGKISGNKTPPVAIYNDSMGSDNAFAAVALPHLDAAFNLARWLTGSRAEAEDVVQEAMVRALTYFPSFRGGSSRAWIL